LVSLRGDEIKVTITGDEVKVTNKGEEKLKDLDHLYLVTFTSSPLSHHPHLITFILSPVLK